MLEVEEGGTLTTIQDGGRPEYAHLGVPVGGACDPWSLEAANLLQGNDPTAPVLEVTLSGATFRVLRTCTVALAGADLDARIPEELRWLAPGGVHLLRAGTHLRFADRKDGARAYLALAGGIAAPYVLGSAATCLAGGFGGIEGRALRAGDRLLPARPDDLDRAGRRWPAPPAWHPVPERLPVTLRVVAGPHARGGSAGAARRSLDALCSREWQVAPESDRTGLRLLGPPLGRRRDAGVLVSTGMRWGAVQAPPDGSPIVLLADAPPVGGYPVPAVVIRADLPVLGQLAPGDRLRFETIAIPEAQELYRERRRALDLAAGRLARDDSWDDLAGHAGG